VQLARGAPGLLVVDVRGNGGGSSAPADDVLRAIWGPAAPGALNRRRAKASLWRASDGVIANLQQRRTRIAQRYPQELPGFDALLGGLKRARQDGQPLYRHPLPAPAAGQRIRPGPSRTIVITDSTCISACLDFLDRMLEAPGVIHAGQETGADTLYTEVRSVPLPSGRGVLTIPMQMLEGRQRRARETYKPSVALADDRAVQAWLSDQLQSAR